MDDKRFAHVATDPKFRRIPKGERKVKIDKRFQSMFKDKRFKVKYTTDKRGRPVNHTSTEDLKRYYELSSEDSSSESDEAQAPGRCVRTPKPDPEQTDLEVDKRKSNDGEGELEVDKHKSNDGESELEVEHKFDRQIPDGVRKKLKDLQVNYARGEGTLYTDSSSDDEPDTEESGSEGEVEHKWGELDADADRTEEATYRLAACNMDWDRIRAVDLMVLFNSFLPQSGLIKSVVIYPSEFGLQRMKEEEVNGPTELVENKSEEVNQDETEEGSKYHMEKLRQYQLNRLKYYYAIITCDNASTANKIYTECDGLEYESSATKMDLRFVPDDMTFDTDPKELCDNAPEMSKYQPRFFTTTALQQAKVNLTWDETNPERIEITQKLAKGKVDDVTETDLQAYLASSSGEEGSEDENDGSDSENGDVNPIDKYRALLNEIEDKDREKGKQDVEMEITWGIDLKEKTENLVKKKLSESENKTPFQQYLDKRKEKRKQKRNKHLNETNDSEDDSEVPSDIDLNDPYFAEEFDKPEFKRKKKLTKASSEEDPEDKQKQAELELLLLNEDDGKKHFSLKTIQEQENESKSKKRRKKKKEVKEKVDDFEVKVDDERFSALFTSHHFNIDPTDPHYKKTKGIEKLISEKLKRRNADDALNDVKKPKLENRRDAELSVLVKSVKRKTEAFSNKKR